MLREPWKYPEGSEKDEYEQVSQHRMIRNSDGDVIAVGRVHMNSAEEAKYAMWRSKKTTKEKA